MFLLKVGSKSGPFVRQSTSKFTEIAPENTYVQFGSYVPLETNASKWFVQVRKYNYVKSDFIRYSKQVITQKFGSEVFFFLPVGDLKVKILLVGKSSLAIPYAESRTVSRRQQQMKYRRKY